MRKNEVWKKKSKFGKKKNIKGVWIKRKFERKKEEERKKERKKERKGAKERKKENMKESVECRMRKKSIVKKKER